MINKLLLLTRLTPGETGEEVYQGKFYLLNGRTFLFLEMFLSLQNEVIDSSFKSSADFPLNIHDL